MKRNKKCRFCQGILTKIIDKESHAKCCKSVIASYKCIDKTDHYFETDYQNYNYYLKLGSYTIYVDKGFFSIQKEGVSEIIEIDHKFSFKGLTEKKLQVILTLS